MAFPDVNFAVQELIADSQISAVLTRWILTGIHSGEFRRAAATGTGLRLTDYRLTELVTVWSSPALMLADQWFYVGRFGC